MPGWPDVEAVLVTALAQFGDTGTETPTDLQGNLPFIRVIRRGGPNDRISDQASVDIDVFAATRASGVPLCEVIRQYLLTSYEMPEIDRVSTSSGPQELPWDDPNVRRWVSSYQVISRRAA